MNKVRRKLFGYRAKKVISYFVGFPLLLIMVLYGSLEFFSGPAFDGTKLYGVIAVAGLWLLITLLQIGFSLLCKNHKRRALFSAIIAVILILGGAIAFDAYATSKTDEVRDTYAEKGVELDAYTKDVNYYVRWTTSKDSNTKELNDDIARFSLVYNVEFEPKVYGDKNADLSTYFEDEKKGIYLNENGMYPDGYVFGVEEAVDILITYHEITDKFAANNKNVEVELQKAIAALENNSSSDWSKYKQTDEYKDAYGTNGDAYRYMLSIERLDTILGVLGARLEKPLGLLLKDPGVKMILPEALSGIEEHIGPNLNVDVIAEVVTGLGLIKDEEGNPAVVTADDIEDLVRGLSFYQMPHLKPIYSFIENEDLQAYAFAKYYATQHGATVGSVLIGDKIGKVVMGSGSFPAENGFTLDELYELKARLEYAPVYYPLFAARRYMYVFGGLIALSFIFAYHYGSKEKEFFEEIYSGEGR